jgi:16S rRNA (cytosine967-C5)-methyltransferase
LEPLQQAGAKLTPSRITTGAWRIKEAPDLLSELVANGQVYLQDEASQLVAQAVDAKEGNRVLDLCAAPGSKTTQIADLTLDAATIVAADLHEHRLRMVVSLAKLHALKSIHPITLHGLQPLPLVEKSFDCVLVDAPCSGTGTLRRNPEIRWRITNDDIKDLSARQQRLLFNAARRVKPGGRLIYSTCSVEPEENEVVVQAFLDNNESFEPAPLPVESLLMTSTNTARTWPQRDGTDGFFISAFRRKGE